MKEDALQKGLPVLDEAAVREQVLRKIVEAPDLATVKDFLRFQAATSNCVLMGEKLRCLGVWVSYGCLSPRRFALPAHPSRSPFARSLLPLALLQLLAAPGRSWPLAGSSLLIA